MAACSGPHIEQGPLFGTGELHPPPKPGASIQSKMCECKACDPSACCDGPEDETVPETCASSEDSYDFSSNPSCGGLAIKSCASHCSRQVWRVKAGDSCATKRPASCCDAG